jgi:putative transposase
MARLARVVIPDLPHHVTQRGNGRQRVFFDDADYRDWRGALARHCLAAGAEVWDWGQGLRVTGTGYELHQFICLH